LSNRVADVQPHHVTAFCPTGAMFLEIDPESWLDRHGDALYAYARQRVRDEHLAEELVQETLVTAIDRLESFRRASSVRTWLIGILRHKLLQHFREAGRERRQIVDELGPEVVDDQFERSGYWKAGPKKWLIQPQGGPEREEFQRAFRECLAKLPARTRDAFLLSEHHQLNGEKLSKILGISATNVYVMLHRARSALRSCLERNWFERDPPRND
jgi:RNA polymerase sigma-70 factor (ECF subfamily)